MVFFRSKKLTLILFATFLFCGKLYSQSTIEVGGEMLTDQEWTKDHFYLVTSDLGISNGVKLTIHPGVKVFISPFVCITCNGGKMIANGEENGVVDSILFIQSFLKHEDGLNYWRNISVSNVSDTSSFYMNYVRIEGGESGLEISNCNNIKVCNTLIQNNRNNGIYLTNVSNSIFKNITYNANYNGIQINANSGNVINNRIINSIFKGGRQNIRAYTHNNGQFVHNVISNNFFENANTAIYIQDLGTANTSKNWICNNVISTTGNGSSGLWIYADSVQIKNNIFWNNEKALRFTNSLESTIENNTFYRNDSCIWSISDSWNAHFKNNTFSENNYWILRIPHSSFTIENNNFLYNQTKPIIYNLCSDSVDLKHNFWGTTNDSIINADYFWDSDNDEELGELIYSPYLDSCNITAPIAPPYNFKKQWIDGKVKLSWNKNLEKDIKGYKIYSGTFEQYNFSQFLSFTNDTAIFLESTYLNTFGITAIDSLSDSTNYNRYFESAFAIAQYYPYAGGGDTLCENVNEYQIESASVPFPNAGMNWTTSGTGTFKNAHEIHTTYYPSKEDFQRKKITLSLNVTGFGGQIFTDKFQLILSYSPIAFAGNDSIVGINQDIQIVDSYVENNSSFWWETLGDGHFDDSTSVNPKYFLGEIDKKNGIVSLIIRADSKCGETSDTVSYTLLPTYNLSGKIWYDGIPYSNAQVVAINTENHNSYFLSRTQSNNEGVFVFDNLFKGIYSVVALPDTLESRTTFSYYANKHRWQDAHLIDLFDNTYDIDIQLSSQYATIVGEGKISGIFEMPVSDFRETKTFCADWFNRNSECSYCNGGLSNIALNLYNSDGSTILDYTLTDSKGRFCFDSLPFGNYLIVAELSGYSNINTQAITLSPENQFVNDISFSIQTDKILFHRNNNNINSESEYVIFPNPVSDKIFLTGNNSQVKAIKITNIIGNEIVNIENNDFILKDNQIEIGVKNFSSGVYFISVFDQQKTKTLKFIKH